MSNPIIETRNLTFRYPIYSQFGGKAVRLTFDNYCGTEPVTLNKTTLLADGAFLPVTFAGSRAVTIGAGEAATSDPVAVNLRAGETVHVSFYLADFTLMRSVVFTCGKRSVKKGHPHPPLYLKKDSPLDPFEAESYFSLF